MYGNDPLTRLTRELATIAAERDRLAADYNRLRERVAEIEAERPISEEMYAAVTAERDRLAGKLAAVKAVNKNLDTEAEHLTDQIAHLGDLLMTVFNGPMGNESACEMAQRVLLEQRAELAAVQAELPGLLRNMAEDICHRHNFEDGSPRDRDVRAAIAWAERLSKEG